jgi:uncharacterized membrane protein
MSGTTTNYFKFYLPILFNGTSPHYSQSVTLTGKNVLVKSVSGVNAVKIRVSFPTKEVNLGFDRTFFNFDSEEKIISFSKPSTIEFYTSGVSVSLGLYA